MKKTDIEKILKTGSIKQKVKLLFTDYAIQNLTIVDFNTQTTEKTIEGKCLLSNEDRNSILESIKTKKDREYFYKIKNINSVFLFFKERSTVEAMKLKAYYYFINSSFIEYTQTEKNKTLINKLLDLYPDKKQREEALKLALQYTKIEGSKISKNKKIDYLEIQNFYFIEISQAFLNSLNTAKYCKEMIEVFKRILAEDLPLQPYKDWVKLQEKDLIKTIEAIYNITSGLDYYPKNLIKFKKYEDIETEITEEDIKDFKNSNL